MTPRSKSIYNDRHLPRRKLSPVVRGGLLWTGLYVACVAVIGFTIGLTWEFLSHIIHWILS